MQSLIILKEHQYPKWDEFVRKHPNGWLTHLSSWQLVLKSLPNISNSFILAVVDDITGEICAGLPIYITNTFLHKSSLIAAPLTTIYDILFSDESQFGALITGIMELYNRTSSSKIIIKPLYTAKYFNKIGFNKDKTFLYHRLILEDSLEKTYKKFHRSCIRQHITKSAKYPMKIRIVETKEDIKSFYKLYQITRKKHGLPALPYNYFESIWRIYSPSKNVFIFLLEYKSKPISGLMAFKYKKHFSAEALGWDIVYKDFNPAIYIFWEAIKFALELGCSSFDFGRTSTSNKNLIAFKRRWGSEEIEMPIYSYSTASKRKGVFRKNKIGGNIAHHIYRLSPCPIYTGLSNLYYRLFCE